MPSTEIILAAKDPKDRLAVALDVPSEDEAIKLADRLGDTCQWFKVGMELYYAAGNSIIQKLRDRGFNIFLDLKLHDIPNTVAGAVRAATKAGASLLTIHASGGAAMMTAAAEAASAPGSPRLLAVTVLTSMDANQLSGIGITASPAEQVFRLAKLAQRSGIDGMVCSPEEVAILRRETGPNTLLVIPGIRPAGASLLVVGRPITRAADPAAAAQAILKEIEESQSAARQANRKK
jgi:orotidine-5'-phosphate decarboxylase